MGLFSSLVGSVVGNKIDIDNMKDKINFKLGLRRLVIVTIGIIAIFCLIIAFAASEWISIIVIPLYALVAYGVYLLIEKVFIWVLEGFKK